MSVQWMVPLFAAWILLAGGCAGKSPEMKTGKRYFGLASHYGPEWDGRRTASGATFHNSELTAAHKTLPFGTKVRVTLLSTQKSVVVRINDRGPFTRGREIDLSDEAARRIGLDRHGVAEVLIEVLEPERKNAKDGAKPTSKKSTKVRKPALPKSGRHPAVSPIPREAEELVRSEQGDLSLSRKG